MTLINRPFASTISEIKPRLPAFFKKNILFPAFSQNVAFSFFKEDFLNHLKHDHSLKCEKGREIVATISRPRNSSFQKLLKKKAP